MNVYLIGYMYSGKTTLGRQLAQRLGYDFVDLDQLFEEKYHTSIPLFFNKWGEAAFRQLEHSLLESTRTMQRTVISCGGGTPCQGNNMDLILEMGLSVYLHLDYDAICARMSRSRKVRPVLANMDDEARRDFVKQQLVQREEYYGRAAIVFDAFGESVDEISTRLYELVFTRLHSDELNEMR